MRAKQQAPARRGRQSPAFAPQGMRHGRRLLRRRPKSETIDLIGTGIRGMSV
jgi:hypothetical protein